MSSVVSQIARLGRVAREKRNRKSDPGQQQRKQSQWSNRPPAEEQIQLLSDNDFLVGIGFSVKLIGSMDIPRPMSRVEIVAAMRRVRFEFKSKGIKKRKIKLQISIDGVMTILCRKINNDKIQEVVIKEHPIYRIFYVSHDSQDVKIFSYIARESNTNLFHCCVFKSKNKKQALKIVRIIGQAFEVCHKMGIGGGSRGGEEEEEGEEVEVVKKVDKKKKVVEDEEEVEQKEVVSSRNDKPPPPPPPAPPPHHLTTTDLLQTQIKQLKTEKSILQSQLNLTRDQLTVESSARLESQERVQLLIIQNHELLEHLRLLVKHIEEEEGGVVESLIGGKFGRGEEGEVTNQPPPPPPTLPPTETPPPQPITPKREVAFNFDDKLDKRTTLGRSVSEKMNTKKSEKPTTLWSRHTTK